MTISGKTTVRIAECECNVDVIFQMPVQRLDIIIPFTSGKSLEVADFLYPNRFGTIAIVNEKGEKFTAYDCICLRRVTNIDKIIISGQYKTLIKGINIPQSGVLSFHFEGLEHYLSQESELKNLDHSLKENEWSLINNEGTIRIATKLSGIEYIEALITPLLRVREYFEFLIDSEIYIDQVGYLDESGTSIEILNDKLLMSKNACLFDKTASQKTDEIEKGINQWLSHYEPYKEVFKIWRKTIYNRQVSVEDIFIWRCQSLELLCTLYQPLLDDAKRLINNPKKQSFPNLSNFLVALNAKCNFIMCDNAYFDEVKDVRNVYTHYNPNKHISEREWRNASHLIESALKAGVGYVMGLDIKDTGFFFLIPKGTMEEIRR